MYLSVYPISLIVTMLYSSFAHFHACNVLDFALKNGHNQTKMNKSFEVEKTIVNNNFIEPRDRSAKCVMNTY